jgi:hypothetical protein
MSKTNAIGSLSFSKTGKQARAIKFCSLLMTIAMILTLLPFTAVPALAEAEAIRENITKLQVELTAVITELTDVQEAMKNTPVYIEVGIYNPDYLELMEEENRLNSRKYELESEIFMAELNLDTQEDSDELKAWQENFNSLPYEEQMRRLKQDWDFHMTQPEEKNTANTAAANAAKPIPLKVNGRAIPTDSPPVQESGRTLAPVRAVVEALGYIVAWDSGTQTIDIYDIISEDLRISLRIGSNRAKIATGIRGVMDEKILDVPARTINGRTMVPVRFIAETLGCTVGWDEETRTVSITQAAG